MEFTENAFCPANAHHHGGLTENGALFSNFHILYFTVPPLPLTTTTTPPPAAAAATTSTAAARPPAAAAGIVPVVLHQSNSLRLEVWEAGSTTQTKLLKPKL